MKKKLKVSSVGKVFLVLLLVFLGAFLEYKWQYLARYSRSNRVANDSEVTKLARLMQSAMPSDKQKVDFNTFWEVWGILEKNYIDLDKVDEVKMVDGAIEGLTASLGDPYTMYLPPKDNERSGQDLAGSFYGVGIELGYIDGFLAVISPLDGSPAQTAGVKAGDYIINVKDIKKGIDEDSSHWSLLKAVDSIRGPKGDIVTLTLMREGVPDAFDVDIKRGEIIVESVKLEFVEHDNKRVAHIKLSRFGERTKNEWDKVVKEILAQDQKVDGIILDMRNNPGGFFDVSIDVASDFIEKGVVVSQKDRVVKKDYSARGKARLKNYPLEVLVNKGSASASEIVAGAVRDRLGAKLVGENSFGKGTVQDRVILKNGGGLHVTVAKWLLPKGAWIHHEGLPVDIEVSANPDTKEDEQLLKAIEEL